MDVIYVYVCKFMYECEWFVDTRRLFGERGTGERESMVVRMKKSLFWYIMFTCMYKPRAQCHNVCACIQKSMAISQCAADIFRADIRVYTHGFLQKVEKKALTNPTEPHLHCTERASLRYAMLRTRMHV
jgi:hypothetical protein